MTPGSALGFVFLQQNGRHIGQDLFAPRALGSSIWLTGLISRSSRTLPCGGVSNSSRGTQHLWLSNIFSRQRAAGGWWTLRKRHRLTVSGLIWSCCSFRILADSSCDFKYSYDLYQLCVNLEDFFHFRDDEKQCHIHTHEERTKEQLTLLIRLIFRDPEMKTNELLFCTVGV